jgi:hypothetical protein
MKNDNQNFGWWIASFGYNENNKGGNKPKKTGKFGTERLHWTTIE